MISVFNYLDNVNDDDDDDDKALRWLKFHVFPIWSDHSLRTWFRIFGHQILSSMPACVRVHPMEDVCIVVYYGKYDTFDERLKDLGYLAKVYEI